MYQKLILFGKINGEEWSRKNIFEIPPWGDLSDCLQHLSVLGITTSRNGKEDGNTWPGSRKIKRGLNSLRYLEIDRH